MSLGELHAGVLAARDDGQRGRREERLRAVRRIYISLPVDEQVAESYGELLATARRQRRTEKATDLLIIATAAAHDRALITADRAQARLAAAAGVGLETP